MEKRNSLLMNTSILYRYTQKYYDKNLDLYQIGAGQLQFLILIYEHEGITMSDLSLMGGFDKGTVTKGIQRLEAEGYITTAANEKDKRIKHLYTCDKTKIIIPEIYLVRQEWWEKITQGLSEEELQLAENVQAKLIANASALTQPTNQLKIFGMQKLTLLDYPSKLASTLFTGGCNFRCPFCQNADLVFLPEDLSEINSDDLESFLKQRQKTLDGICISGGEPLLHEELEPFLYKLKGLGYKVKLDTNGSYPKLLKKYAAAGLIDYVAMDIKNDKAHYAKTIGLESFDLSPIEESVDFLLRGDLDYEFRTTVVRDFHSEKEISAAAEWLKGAKAYYLQAFVDSECVIQKGLQGYDADEMQKLCEAARKFVPNTQVRGL